MAVSIIDGRVETADVKRHNRHLHQYRILSFALDGGGERVIRNAVVDNRVAARLQPGSAGRFYLFQGVDMRGVYAYRDPQGDLVQGFPGQNEKLGLIGAGLAVAAMILFALFSDGIPWIVFIALVLSIVGFFFTRQTRTEVERATAEDRLPAGPAAATAAVTRPLP
ncbi:MAG TPA: hypothetical protein VEB68_14705 [Croceibacterium sp.]|nr:hypothetical protein [Croceibacterium sp.]